MNGSWVRIVLAIALLFALSGGSAQHEALAAPDAASAVITFVCCQYTPKQVVIQPGQSVEWDGDFSMHPLVSDDGLWPTKDVGTQFTYTFPVTGTFNFHCFFHGSFGMVGSVIVKELPNKIYLPVVLSM